MPLELKFAPKGRSEVLLEKERVETWPSGHELDEHTFSVRRDLRFADDLGAHKATEMGMRLGVRVYIAVRCAKG